jgi:hypothetical protein
MNRRERLSRHAELRMVEGVERLTADREAEALLFAKRLGLRYG